MKADASIMEAEGIDGSVSLAEHVRSQDIMHAERIVRLLEGCMFMGGSIQELDNFCVKSARARGITIKYGIERGYEHALWILKILCNEIKFLSTR